jgi:hypothetical protein
MAVIYRKNKAIFKDIVGIDETEPLLAWLHKYPKGKIDLSSCSHLHAANLQVLMAAQPMVTAFPCDAAFAGWIGSVLKK